MALDQIAPALVKAQAELSDPVKDAKNPHFKSRFVSLKGVLDSIRPVLHKHGIAIVQAIDFDGERPFVNTLLLHVSGQFIESRCPVVSAKPNDPQAMGSAITYARRYAAAAICGVAPADEDDDGESAVVREEPAPKRSTVIPYDTLEVALEDIKEAKSMAALKTIGLKLAESKLAGTDRDTAREAWSMKREKFSQPS